MMALDAKDRLATVATCLEAVVDLAVPATDLSAVDRDKLAVLLLFLTEEYQAAAAQLGFR